MRCWTVFLTLVLLTCIARAEESPLRLPAWAAPLAYRLDLRIDPADARHFSGHAAITVELKSPSDTLWLNGQGLVVDKVVVTTADGRQLPASYVPVRPADGVARVDFGRLLPAQRLVVSIDYTAAYVGSGDTGAFLIEQDGRRYVATETEPLGARRIFPSFDEPGFKTPYTVSLTVPHDMVALANARQIGESSHRPGWKTLTFATTRPLPSYLVAFAVGPWALTAPVPLAPDAARPTAVPLRAVTYAGQLASMRRVMEEAPGIVRALEDYYGAAYPWDKLDLLDIDGGMENPGLVSLGDLGSAADDAPTRALQGAFELTAHELAHQWSGDLVTMDWWDDLWLNESLALWMQYKLSLQLHPAYRADLARVRDVQQAMAEDSLSSARRVRQPIKGPGDIANAFDGNSYGKGAAVLGMFEGYLGEPVFQQGMRQYMRMHAFGSAVAADLIDALVAAAQGGDVLRRAFYSFLDQPGLPYVRVSLVRGRSGVALRMEQGRYRPLGATPGTPGRWGVPVCVRYASGGSTRRRCQLLTDVAGTMVLPGAEAGSWVMPNAEARGYYRFGMTSADWKRLAPHVDALSEAERLAYADAVAAGFQYGDRDAGDVLAALKPLARMDGRELAAAVLDQVDWIWRHVAATDAQRRHVVAWVRETYLPRLVQLGYRARPGEAASDGPLRALLAERLALVYRLPEVRAALLAQGDRLLSTGGSRLDFSVVDQDLLKAVLGVLVQERGAAAVQALAGQLFVVHDIAVRRALVAGLTYADSPGPAAQVRKLALDTRARGGEIVSLGLGQHGTRAQREATWRWFADHQRSMFDRLGRVSWVLPEMLGRDGCSSAERDRLQRVFAPRVPGQPALARSLAKARESIQLCMALRQAQDPRTILR
jgi:alanyl aminopeptidase